ncbi:flagellar hook-basal body complex protein FliE [bacterium]|nr:flagellar hook-basal body complex protein FliE [bacterium]
MIENRITPNINIFSDLSSKMPIDEFSQKGFGVSNLDTKEVSFKNVLSGMISNINSEVQKPDQLLNAQMTGNADVDIHDVMTAVAKAEMGVSLATQITSKVVNAYNTVMNLSI